MSTIKDRDGKIKFAGAKTVKQLAEMNRANLQEVDLEGANLQGADLEGANLMGAILWGANLRGANLQGAILQRADLEGARLQGAILQRASLQDANFQGANLRRAVLWRANLQGAHLQGAILQGADLKGADLKGADLTNVKGLVKTMGVEPGNCYWKRFNYKLISNGYQYFVGLNVLPKGETFASDERVLCSYPGFYFASRSWCAINYLGRPLEARIRIPLNAKINEPWSTDGKASADRIEILQVFDTRTGKNVTSRFKRPKTKRRV